MRSIFPLLALGAVFPAVPVLAEPQPFLLDEIVLSGSLTPVPADGYARAYSVVTRAEIEARGLASVEDALRALPGLSVSTSGSSLTQIRIRGGEANHTLVLIDGIEASGGADSHVFSGFGTEDIERIEVLRGPQSVIYGSNASTGVVNIITRRAEPGRGHGGGVEVGNGAAGSAWVTQRGDRGGLALSLAARNDRGFDYSGDGGGKDGLDTRTATLTGDVAATETLRVGAILRRERLRYDYDAENPDWAATDADSYIVDAPLFGRRDGLRGALWAEHEAFDGRLTQRLQWQQSRDRASENDGPQRRGETQRLRYRASVGLDGRVSDARHLLNLLAERQRDTTSMAPDQRRQANAVALEYRARLDGLDVQAGLRHDDNRAFGDFTSWNIAASWQVPDMPLRLRGSAGTGLVNPSFTELFGGFGTIGNPDLRPEQNRSVDLGVDWQWAQGQVGLTWFRESLKDEIEFFATPSGDFSYRNQSGRSPRQGVELAARMDATEVLSLGASYTYLDAKNPDGSVEIRRPRHEAGLNATLALLEGRAQVSGDLRRVSGLWDTQFWGGFETRELPAYTVVNLAAAYDLTPNVRATARVVNLFDRSYSEVWGYASQGRTAYLGLQARW